MIFLKKNAAECVKSELIFPHDRVFKAYLEIRDQSLPHHEHDILECEFAAIVNYSTRLVSFKVCESRFIKFLNESSKSIDTSDFAIGAIKLGIETCIRMYKLASRSTSKQRMQQQKEYLKKLRNCRYLLDKINDLEFNQRLHSINLSSLKALQDGAPDYDEVSRTIDDLTEAISNAEELDQVLSEDLRANSGISVDDESVEREFEKLMEDMKISEKDKNEENEIAEAASQLPSLVSKEKPEIQSTEKSVSPEEEQDAAILFS